MTPPAGVLVVALTLLATSRVVTPVQGKASVLGLVAESATFDDFERVFGRAEIAGCGGSHGDNCGFWACWVGPDGTTLLAGAISRRPPRTPAASRSVPRSQYVRTAVSCSSPDAPSAWTMTCFFAYPAP